MIIAKKKSKRKPIVICESPAGEFKELANHLTPSLSAVIPPCKLIFTRTFGASNFHNYVKALYRSHYVLLAISLTQ